MKTNDLTSLRCFKTIYDTRSLTKASSVLGLSKAAISKRLDYLEQDLGNKLFSRTTRSIVPTSEAEKIILEVNEILERVDGLSSRAKKNKHTSRKIRVTCISSMAQRFVGELIAEFRTKYPFVTVELIVSDSVLDFVENNLDIAIRVNPSKQSSLIGKKVGEYNLVMVASPVYLAKRKKPKTIDDIYELDFMALNQHFNDLPKNVRTPLEQGRRFETNDSPLITQLLIKGYGIGLRSSWDVKALVKQKQLTYVLPEKTFKPQGDIWIVSDREKLNVELVRSLYDFLVARVGQWLE
jgi:LysR family transcriptional regulator, transcriptional activator for dmlA